LFAKIKSLLLKKLLLFFKVSEKQFIGKV